MTPAKKKFKHQFFVYSAFGFWTIFIFIMFNIFSGYQIRYITGTSMEPTLSGTCFGLVESLENKTVEIGDIVTFNRVNGGTIHRTISYCGAGLWNTQGDNNNHPDGCYEPKYRLLHYACFRGG